MRKSQVTKYGAPILWLALNVGATVGQTPASGHDVYVLGNFAEVTDPVAYTAQLEALLTGPGARTDPWTIVLDGDFATANDADTARAAGGPALWGMLDMVGRHPGGQLVLVPGEREWRDGGPGGDDAVRRLEAATAAYAKMHGIHNVVWPVKHACPGPEVLEVNPGLALVAISTQWYNHTHDKPRPTDVACPDLAAGDLHVALDDALEKYTDRNVLLLGHHPISSLGEYGGYDPPARRLLLPAPVAAELISAYHANSGGDMYLSNPRLRELAKQVNRSLHYRAGVVYAAGHERNQQVLRHGANALVNSGAPEVARFAARDQDTELAASLPGVLALHYAADGAVSTLFFEHTDGGFAPSDTVALWSSPCGKTGPASPGTSPASPGTEPGVAPPNPAYVPCGEHAVRAAQRQAGYPGPRLAVAGDEYAAGPVQRFFVGRHYRTTWTEPVRTPYLDLDTTFGGLTVHKRGGGRQTTSLKFRTPAGAEYTFRSVDKDPAKALSPLLRETFVANFLRDQTSTQQPYGAMAVAPLAARAGLLHATPTLYLMPDDAKLGGFRGEFGDLMGMLEESPGHPDSAGGNYFGADKIVQSTDAFAKLYAAPQNRVDVPEFVRARLFDMWIGDWSRHEDNWKWAKFDVGDDHVYRPVPRDRDHAFSRQDGLINWLADRRFGWLNIENFGYRQPDIVSLSWQARAMDRFVAAGADAGVYDAAAAYLQEHVSQADIRAAVARMPAEVQGDSGDEIAAKLTRRLGDLHAYARRYYALMARSVDVVGTNKREAFEVNVERGGAVVVRRYEQARGRNGGQRILRFERRFLPSETKYLRLWGLGADDRFSVSGPGTTAIDLKVFGGDGDDSFASAGPARVRFYDLGERSAYELNGGGRAAKFWDDELYAYDRSRVERSNFRPLVSALYNKFTGAGLVLGVTYTRHRFERREYASKHDLRAGITTNENRFVSYQGRYHSLLRAWDLEVGADYLDSDFFNYFFGVGNATVKDPALFEAGFYQARLRRVDARAGLVRDFSRRSEVRLGVGWERDRNRAAANTILTEAVGLEGANATLQIVPLTAGLKLDFRDFPGLPYRGTLLQAGYEHGVVATGASGDYGMVRASLEQYYSTRTARPFTLALRVGGAQGYGDLPWYKLALLGHDSGLRGYYNNRFAGRSAAYVNSEVRYELAEISTSFVPLKLGVKGFFDVGRVWGFTTGETPGGGWHTGYGGGVYLTPLEEAFTLSVSLGFSEEESVYPSFAFGIPLR